MTTLGLSKYHEPDWDTKLDNMLADLETGSNANPGFQQNNFNFQQQQFFSSSKTVSNQQQMSGGNIQQQQMSYSSSSRSQQGMGGRGTSGSTSYLQKSASSVSLKDSAGEVLKDLENGLNKSSHFIKESHGKVVGPEGTQEWHNVERGGDPQNSKDYDLEMQVQHMMPNLVSYNTGHQQQQQQQQYQQHSYHHQQQAYQQQQQNYQHQEHHRSYQQHQQLQPTIAVEDVDSRPGSRLKQNIDELDNLLYDLNHARNLSPEGGTEYTDTHTTGGLDSDDYSESVGKEGHVKRTVHAFNEYSAQMSSSDVVKKPPSPSPRRKAPHSPSSNRKQQGSMTYMSNQQHSSSTTTTYKTQDMAQQRYTPETRYSPPPSLAYKPSGGQFEPPEQDMQPRSMQEPPQPNYYTKFSSVKQSTTTSSSTDREGQPYKFPSSARSPTPQNMPKQVDELMSEFQEFDTSVTNSVSPKPMFSKPTPIVQVTGPPPDPEPSLQIPGPAPMVVDPTPPKPAAPTPTPAPKGPSVYYPPGHEFSKHQSPPQTVVVPSAGDAGAAEAGGAAVAAGAGSSGAVASMRMESRKEKYAREEKEAQQGAAMIPICLPLCCAAPCVIM